MNNVIKISLCVMIALFVACSCDKSTPPDLTFYIDLTPESSSLAVGDTLVLQGTINSAENLFAISFDLAFDTTILAFEAVSIPQSAVLGGNSINFSNTTLGGVSISLGRTQSGGNDNFSGNGVLFEVRFTAIAPGSTSLVYQNILIIDESGAANPNLPSLETRSAMATVR